MQTDTLKIQTLDADDLVQVSGGFLQELPDCLPEPYPIISVFPNPENTPAPGTTNTGGNHAFV